jgi:hypothetical protein
MSRSLGFFGIDGLADPGRGQLTHVLKGDTKDLCATTETDLLLLNSLAHEPGQAVLDEIHWRQAVGFAR